MPEFDSTTLICQFCKSPFPRPEWCGKYPSTESRATRFCSAKCRGMARRIPTTELFWSHVDKNGPIPSYAPHLGNCWLWTGNKRSGYGLLFIPGESSRYQAPRFSYELENGPIEAGLELDHLCRVAACVRPSHLEPVSHRTNVIRGISMCALNAAKTHCKRGHEFTQQNTGRGKNGKRYCKRCSVEQAIIWSQNNHDKRLEISRRYHATHPR